MIKSPRQNVPADLAVPSAQLDNKSFHRLGSAPFAKMNDASTAVCVDSTVRTTQKQSHACTANGVLISTA